MRVIAIGLATAALSGCIAMPIPRDIWLSARHFGQVTDFVTGQAIQGVQVSVRKPFEPNILATTETDSEGRFRVDPAILHSAWTGVLLLGPAESMCAGIVSFEREGYRTKFEYRNQMKPGTGNCEGVEFEHSVRLQPSAS